MTEKEEKNKESPTERPPMYHPRLRIKGVCYNGGSLRCGGYTQPDAEPDTRETVLPVASA